MWKVYWQTSPGKVRAKNQDFWVNEALESEKGPLLLCGVADGMGGHLAGDVASRIAVEELSDTLRHNVQTKDVSEALRQAFLAANNKVYLESLERAECSGMGTTLTVALLARNDMFLGHVGDSRAYLSSNGQLRRLTQDHSVVEELVRRGGLTAADAEKHPQKHYLTRAIGIGVELELDTLHMGINPGDVLLLCTDGLTRMVKDNELGQAVNGAFSPHSTVNDLVTLAMERGAPDNVTVVLVVWEGDVR